MSFQNTVIFKEVEFRYSTKECFGWQKVTNFNNVYCFLHVSIPIILHTVIPNPQQKTA